MKRVKFFLHNSVVHPICGILWFVGFDSLADWIHNQF